MHKFLLLGSAALVLGGLALLLGFWPVALIAGGLWIGMWVLG